MCVDIWLEMETTLMEEDEGEMNIIIKIKEEGNESINVLSKR